MTDVEVVTLVDNTWRDANPQRRLSALRNVRILVPPDLRPLFDSLVDSKLSNVEDDPEAVVLFLVHGIQTDGAWQKLVQRELHDLPKVNVIDLGYDCVTFAQLVSPFRSTPIDKTARDIRNIRKAEPKARFMVIAHSFGSYIVSKILKDHPDIDFERIILCGAIVPRTFEWDSYTRNMRRGSIINDVGTRDYYPLLATVASVGYGASGLRGFQTSQVIDRYFPFGHSDYFRKNGRHIRLFWKPFIASGRIKPSLWDTRKPKTGLFVLAMSHPWMGRPAFIGGLVLLALFALVIARFLVKLVF